MRRNKELACASTATLARTLPGTLPSVGLQFGVVGRQFRATLMSFAAALPIPFGSMFLLCVGFRSGAGKPVLLAPEQFPWTLFGAQNAAPVCSLAGSVLP